MLNISSFILSSFLILIHPLFVSVIDIKHNAKEKNIEVSFRIFTDDLEVTLKNNYHCNVDLATGSAKADVNKFVANYVQSKLQLTVDNKPKTLKYIGYEIQKESTWIYAQVDDISTLKKLNISCNLLYEFTEKQSNIFNVTANGIEKNYKIDFPKKAAEFAW